MLPILKNLRKPNPKHVSIFRNCCNDDSKQKKTFKVVMLRHGESEWNLQNKFCGWYNANLSSLGKEEAIRSGQTLKNKNYEFDIVFTSVLKRAIETAEIVLKQMCGANIEMVKHWRLNERHYGALTGLNKQETAKKYGEEQVHIWRRSFKEPPPTMEKNHPHYNDIVHNPALKDVPKDEFPMAESLKSTMERSLPYWNETIVPAIKNGRKPLIVAHGNSLRGIIKVLDDISDENIVHINLPTGIPFEYILDENMCPIENGSLIFLGDPKLVAKAIESVKIQGKEKKK